MHHIFDKAKVKIESSVRRSIGCLEVRSKLAIDLGLKMSPSNGLRILNKDFIRFLSRRVKKGSAGRVASLLGYPQFEE